MSLHTPLCDLLNIKYPIIQAGMGWDKEGLTTPPALVAAVSNAGGLGCIGGSSIRPEVIRERIRAVRQLTDKPFGVDITLPKMEDVRIPDPDEVHKEIQEKFPKHAKFNDELIPKLGLTPQPPDRKSWVKTPAATREQLRVILEEKVPILIIGLGDTAEVVPLAHERGIKVMALAGAVEAHQYSGQKIVTVAMHEVKFIAPVFVGDLVSFYTETVRIGTTSITVRVTDDHSNKASSDCSVRLLVPVRCSLWVPCSSMWRRKSR